jgi:hypothetical protein
VALTAAPILPAAYPEQKSVGLAMFLDLIWPGAGHLYAGVGTGLGITFTVISGVFLTMNLVTFFALVITFPGWLIMAVWAMTDVNRKVKDRNRALGYLHAEDVIAARSKAGP